MQTALTGMNAATTMLDVVGQNLASYQTPGFKSSAVCLATSAPQTNFEASSSNLCQSGSGVQVVGVQSDDSQASIQVNDQLPLLALDGDGLFILHSATGQRLFTRDGQFQLNA